MSVVSQIRPIVRLLLLGVALAVPRLVAAQGSADVVLEWNRILNTSLATPGANPATVFVTRPAAIMHIAVFDALNSIDFQLRAVCRGDQRAAGRVARCGRRTGGAQRTRRADAVADARFDAALAANLGRIARPPPRLVLRWAPRRRARFSAAAHGDGWERPNVAYILPNLPGYWQPTPPAKSRRDVRALPGRAGIHPQSARAAAGGSATGHDQRPLHPRLQRSEDDWVGDQLNAHCRRDDHRQHVGVGR